MDKLIRIVISMTSQYKSVSYVQVYGEISLNRFKVIRKFLNVNNKENFKPLDTDWHHKIFKIRPILNKICKHLLLARNKEFFNSRWTKCRYAIKPGIHCKDLIRETTKIIYWVACYNMTSLLKIKATLILQMLLNIELHFRYCAKLQRK